MKFPHSYYSLIIYFVSSSVYFSIIRAKAIDKIVSKKMEQIKYHRYK